MTTTKHTHGPNFGRRVPGCTRCSELAAGAPPIVWTGRGSRHAQQRDAARAEAIRAHYQGGRCSCCPVCTAFDW